MSKNSLYNLIANSPISQIKLGELKISVSQREHKKGKQYFMFELPIENAIKIENLQLISHHVSVYEGPLVKQDVYSQYHYTVYFKDEADQVFRLHVYFDLNDNISGEPILSLQIDEDHYKAIDSQKMNMSLITLAKISTASLMKHLRACQISTIEQLQKNYSQLEEEAEFLSQDIGKNQNEYVAKIDQIIRVLQTQACYSNESNVQVSKINFFTRLKQAALNYVAPIEDSHHFFKRVQHSQVQQKIVNDSEKKQSKKQSKKKNSVQTTVIDSASKEINNLCGRLENFASLLKSSKNNSEVVYEALSMFADAKMIECGIQFEYKKAAFHEIKKLHLVQKNINKYCISLLQKMLFSDDYDEARKLKMFFTLSSPHSFLEYSLAHRKPQLLDFLLQENIISVHTKNIQIQKEEFKSLVDYCFKKDNEKQPCTKLLAVLINRGASLFEMDYASQLPFAAVIMMNPKHPFMDALKQHAKITLNNPQFYIDLNQVLSLLILRPTCPVDREQDIESLMRQNEQALIDLKCESIDCRPLTVTHSITQCYANRIELDHEINALKQKAIIRYEEIQKKLLPKQNKKLCQLIDVSKTLDNFDLDNLDKLEQLPTIESVKKNIIISLLLFNKILDLLDEKLDILKKIKVYNSPKEVKKCQARIKLIDSEIQTTEEDLKSRVSVNDEIFDEYNANHDNELEFLNNLKERLDPIMNVFEVEMNKLGLDSKDIVPPMSEEQRKHLMLGLFALAKNHDPKKEDENPTCAIQ